MPAEWDKCQARKPGDRRCYGARSLQIDGVWLCSHHVGSLRARGSLWVYVHSDGPYDNLRRLDAPPSNLTFVEK